MTRIEKAEVKAAQLKYQRAVAGQDRYRASVFVSEAMSEYWTRLVAEAREEMLKAEESR